MTPLEKIELLRQLLLLRVHTNHDSHILHCLHEWAEEQPRDDLFKDSEEWDNIAMATAAEKCAILKIHDWSLNAIHAVNNDLPIPPPPLGEL